MEFTELKRMDLNVSRAWAIKEMFRDLWRYVSEPVAWKFWKRWYFWATHSRLKVMHEGAKTVKNHITGVMNYFKYRVTNATAESINSKIQKIKQMACGFRNIDNFKTAIYFHCGGLDLYPLGYPRRSDSRKRTHGQRRGGYSSLEIPSTFYG